MAHTDPTQDCYMPLGHADYAAYVIGALAQSRSARVRSELADAVYAASMFHQIPPWVEVLASDIDDQAPAEIVTEPLF